MCNAERIASTILSLLAEIETIYKDNQDLIYEREQESTDLSHEIEFSNFNAFEGFRLARELQTVLQERREYKNDNETMQILYDFITPQFKNGLIKCLQSIKSKESQQKTRLYTPKVRTDLTVGEVKIL